MDPIEATKKLIVGSKDGSIYLWSLLTGRCIGVGQSHNNSIKVVAFGKNESFTVSLSTDRIVKIWSIHDNNNIGVIYIKLTIYPRSLWVTASIIAHQTSIHSIRVAPNNRLIATGGQDKTVRLWTIPNLTSLRILKGHSKGIFSLDFSPLDKILVTSSLDLSIRLWSLESGSCVRILKGHGTAILRTRFLQNGLHFASADAGGIVKIWNIRSIACQNTLNINNKKVWSLSFTKESPHRNLLFVGGENAYITVLEAKSKVNTPIAVSLPSSKQKTNNEKSFSDTSIEIERASLQDKMELVASKNFFRKLSTHALIYWFDRCRKWIAQSCFQNAQHILKYLFVHTDPNTYSSRLHKCYENLSRGTKYCSQMLKIGIIKYYSNGIKLEELPCRKIGENIDPLTLQKKSRPREEK
jgi:WD40 repeat protein